MQEARHDKSKEETNLERLNLFTDGVFAIAITLLVIEIKVPVLAVYTDHHLLEHLSEIRYKFLGLLISFVIIGYYWAVHHRIYGYVKKYTLELFWYNAAFLFSIIILPFSSGLVGEFSSHTDMHVPYIVYCINMIFAGMLNSILWIYVSNPRRDLLTRKISRSRIKLGFYRSMIFPSVFLLSMLVSFFLPVISKLLLLLIPVLLRWGMKKLERKADKEEGIVAEIEASKKL